MVHHFAIFAVKCSNLCNHLDDFYTQAREKQKNTPPPPKKKKRKNNKKTKSNLLYFRKWSFLVLKKNLFKLSSPKKLNKTFYTLDKTPFWKTGCLSNLYYILAAQASSFLIHLLWLTRNHVVPEVTTLIYFFVT